MLSAKLGELLKAARKRLAVSREDLARRAGVSVRLVAELERGQRANVSLESALRLLNEVGVTITAQAPHGELALLRSPHGEELQRLARAAQRRKTWTSRIVLPDDGDSDPRPPRSAAERIAAVSKLSRQASAIAAMPRVRSASSGSRAKRPR